MILVTTGIDTFSKLNSRPDHEEDQGYEGCDHLPRERRIHCREYCETHPGAATLMAWESRWAIWTTCRRTTRCTRLPDDRRPRVLPAFEGELPEIFQDIISDIRNQYTVSYSPDQHETGWHLPQAESGGGGADGSPLKVSDQKGKDVKIDVVAGKDIQPSTPWIRTDWRWKEIGSQCDVEAVVEKEEQGAPTKHNQSHVHAGFFIYFGNKVGCGDIDRHSCRKRQPAPRDGGRPPSSALPPRSPPPKYDGRSPGGAAGFVRWPA